MIGDVGLCLVPAAAGPRRARDLSAPDGCDGGVTRVAPVRRASTALAAACVAVLAPSSFAAEVNLSVSTYETFVGVPVTVQITIVNPTRFDPPEFPDLPNAEVRRPDAASTSMQTVFVNGQVRQTKTYSYTYSIVPREPGDLVIPALAIQADGRTFNTRRQVVRVAKSDTGDLLFVEVRANRKRIYVGESLDVVLEIWLRPFTDRRLGVQLDENDMGRCIDGRNSQFGRFVEALQRRNNLNFRRATRKDSGGATRFYYVYELPLTGVYPDKPGPLDLGTISIVVNYPTRLARSRSMFDVFDNDGLSVADTRPISAVAACEPIEIRAIPTEGRPPYYSGAVGPHKLQVTARPTDVSVGDPITLTMSLSGAGSLELLRAPALHELSELKQDFKVPADALAGVVEGGVKKFTQSIRPTSDRVTEIPAIPFAFFDPLKEKFVTIRSRPIPITVRPVQSMAVSQIVEASGGQSGAPSHLTESAGGILANYTGMDDLLAQQALSPGWGAATVLIAPPAVYLVCLLTQRRRNRMRSDVGYARRSRAGRAARRALQAAAQLPPSEQLARAASALRDYVADRCNRPQGGLTAAETAETLRIAGVPAGPVAAVRQFLSACEAAQYAGAAARRPDGAASPALAAAATSASQHAPAAGNGDGLPAAGRWNGDAVRADDRGAAPETSGMIESVSRMIDELERVRF